MGLDLMSPGDVAAALNLTGQNVGRLAREGQLRPAATVGGMRVYERAEVQRVADERRARVARGERIKMPAI